MMCCNALLSVLQSVAVDPLTKVIERHIVAHDLLQCVIGAAQCVALKSKRKKSSRDALLRVVCCSVVQCVAQCVATCCSEMNAKKMIAQIIVTNGQCVALKQSVAHCSTLQHTCNTPATHYNTLEQFSRDALLCTVITTRCNTLQHTTTHQHTAA